MSVIITVLIYSAILTAVFWYKDTSSYSSGCDPIDLVVAGPCAWVLIGVIAVIDLVKMRLPKKVKKKKPVKHYSKREVEKTVSKIIKWFKKKISRVPDWYPRTFVMEQFYEDEGEGISDLIDLIDRKPSHEYTNEKFKRMVYHQIDLVKEVLSEKYMRPWTIEEYRQADFNEYWIQRNQSKKLWRVL